MLQDVRAGYMRRKSREEFESQACAARLSGTIAAQACVYARVASHSCSLLSTGAVLLGWETQP